jgi:glycosyltransferase involved in cell wall biosynthesis
MKKIPKYLFVVASSCQMYSGTGTAMFDWIRFAKDDFDFSILMDVENETNLKITRNFCQEHGVKFYASGNMPLPGCADTGIDKVFAHLSANYYDFIECLSWANAATNLSTISAKCDRSKLVYTPHSQPLWTLPNHERYFMTTLAFRETLNAADYIFIDSPSERLLMEFSSEISEKIHFVPLGVDISKYNPATVDKIENQILCVCDCREARKRVDLLLATFSAAHARNNQLKFILAGKGSDTLFIPADISKAVIRLGYVTEEILIQLYRTSSLFVLLSDYEAFGLPIAEALCCGCPVLLNRQDALIDLFSSLPGVTFTNNVEIEATVNHLLNINS